MPYKTNTALIIVDVQNDFCPGGRLEVMEGDKIIPTINALKPNFALTVYTQDWHPAEHKSFASAHEEAQEYSTIEVDYGEQVLWPDHCVQETDGAAFHKDLEVGDDALILQKGTNAEVDSYSGFIENDKKTQPLFANGKTLVEVLKEKEIKNIVFCGLAYDFCVGWHALDARKEGFETIIVKDACRSISKPLEGESGTSETAMDAALKEAGVHVVKTGDLQDSLKN